MDLEKARISMRITAPYIPVTGALVHRLPKTCDSDGRVVGCISGWALAKLGVSQELLAGQKNPDEAIKAAKPSVNVPRGIFTKVAELHDRKHVKEAAQQLKSELSNNSVFLSNTFGSSKLASLKSELDGMLAAYDKKDAPPVYRRK